MESINLPTSEQIIPIKLRVRKRKKARSTLGIFEKINTYNCPIQAHLPTCLLIKEIPHEILNEINSYL
jgi:hypothetical protein